MTSDERKFAVLLGAGASVQAGIPTSSKLTALAVEHANAAHPSVAPASVMNYVIGAMIGADSRKGISPTELPDIERVVSAVRLLIDKKDLEVSPFVAAWDGVINDYDRGETTYSTRLDRLDRGPFSRGPIEEGDLKQAKFQTRAEHHPSRLLSRLLQFLSDFVADIVSLNVDCDLAYLEPLVRLCGRGRVHAIASLNYDLTVETAAQRLGVGVSTGFDHWLETRQLNFNESGARLAKLHGSLSWNRPVEDNALSTATQPWIVLGQREKLHAEGPFLQLLEWFRARLFEVDNLLVAGYSYRDNHINTLIDYWLSSSPSRRLLSVDPYARHDDREDHQLKVRGARILESRYSPRGSIERRAAFRDLGFSDVLARLSSITDPCVVFDQEIAALTYESADTYSRATGNGGQFSVAGNLFV